MPALIASDPTPSARALMLARGNDARLAAAFSGKKEAPRCQNEASHTTQKKTLSHFLHQLGHVLDVSPHLAKISEMFRRCFIEMRIPILTPRGTFLCIRQYSYFDFGHHLQSWQKMEDLIG